MKHAKGTRPGEIRIILCIEFDRRATPSEVSALKAELCDSPDCVQSIEVTGAFDVIAEFAAPGIGWYKSWLARLAEPFARVVKRYEVNFVFGRSVSRLIDEDAVWVPDNGGFKRIDNKLINKISAEGDYVRIYSQGQSWMLHETMKSVSRRLPSAEFIRLHRSTIVQFRFINRVARENGHWTAYLLDGSKVPVARSHVPETLEVVRARGRALAETAGAAMIRENLLPSQS